MSLSVIHVFSRKCHRTILVLTRGVIRKFGLAGFEGFDWRGRVDGRTGVVGLEVEVCENRAVGFFGYFNGYAVSSSKPAFLPGA